MILRQVALPIPTQSGYRRTLCGVAAGIALLPIAAAAQTPATPNVATPMIPPTRQYPGIQSEQLAPPPGLGTSPAAQNPAVTTPESPLPPNVVTPNSPPAPSVPQATTIPGAPAAPATPNTAAPTAPVQPQPGTPAVTTPTQPSQPLPQAAAPLPPNPWIPQGGAVVQVLDKPDAQSATLTIKLGQPVTFRSLTITAKACDIRPPDMVPNATAFLDITDSHPGQQGFSGWMFASDPSLNMLQSAIYNVRVKGCTP